jgi:AAA15 family ATPase/GTPase
MIEDALRFVEPDVERVASSNVPSSFAYDLPARGGFKVKLKNVAQPIPIGSLGDGTWRMLAMAIALSRARNGVLLIDEIDTGLHHTVMTDMWRLVYESARRFNIQIFATTHSYDCVHSLASICEEGPAANNVTIQRVEMDRQKAIPFTDPEIRMAARKDIELR